MGQAPREGTSMTPVQGAPPVASLWQMLWQVVGVSQAESGALWAKLHQSRDPHCIAWRYGVQRYMDLFSTGNVDESLPWQFLDGPWRGQVVIDALERLVIERLLSRRDANRYEEIYLRQMDQHGGWLFRRIDASENPQKSDGFQLRANH
jgi:hypothetical protein